MKRFAFLVVAVAGSLALALAVIWAPEGSSQSASHRVAWVGQAVCVLAALASAAALTSPRTPPFAGLLNAIALPVLLVWFASGLLASVLAHRLGWRSIATGHLLAFGGWAVVAAFGNAVSRSAADAISERLRDGRDSQKRI
jgi:hypothetical protein